MNRGTFESLMIIRIREGTRIRVAADRDGGIDVGFNSLIAPKKKVRLTTEWSTVYQLLGSNAGTDRYHDRYNCSCIKLHD